MARTSPAGWRIIISLPIIKLCLMTRLFLESSGIRLGVQEMTRFGMKEKDFEILAGLMAEVIRKNKPVKDEVKRYRQGFVEMKYCRRERKPLELARNYF